MALEVIKPPLQPASQGAGGSYGTAPMSTQMDNTFSTENCNPNKDKEAAKPGKPKKTPVKSKPATPSENGHDLGKSPVRRRLDCDGGAHEALGKSPGKAASLKDTTPSPHKHFCRSPRCAANNPDYAVPAPRQYLKSKRRLLAGWQAPLNSKLKAPVTPENASDGCIFHNHEQSKGKDHGEVPHESCSTTDLNVHDGESGADPRNLHSKWLTEESLDTNALNLLYDRTHDEEVANFKDRSKLPAREPLFVVHSSLKKTGEVVLPVSTCRTIVEAIVLNTKNQEMVVRRADPIRTSMRTDSDLSMRSIGEEGSDSRRETFGSSRPPRSRYRKRGGQRLSSDTGSNQSVTLNKREGLKRKQADEWMWDTAVQEAVQRLAPHVPAAGSVNVLVKAFESVRLTEEEIRRAKYTNDRVALDGTRRAFGPHLPHMEAIASISKVQAWDESMASADLVDEITTDKLRQDEENCPLTPPKSQARIPQFSSQSEPPKALRSRWAAASDESINGIKDDGCSEIGASSTSGRSRITDWTCGSKSQAGLTRKPKFSRCTSLHPFRLRTEERGAVKEHMFSKRLQQLWEEEERLRIPLAQGLPWTTDEPAVPPKPLVKEQTKLEGFKLFTDVRAVERAEFDEFVAERNSQMELHKQEEERQRQVAMEEEVRRLRREMVPRAQLMPYFDRPFMPRRSSKKLTVPREPNFHLKQNKRPRCMATSNSIVA